LTIAPRCPACPPGGALPGRLRSSSSSPCSLTACPCPRHGPQSLADGLRPLAQTRQRSPEGLKPVRRFAPAGRPTLGPTSARRSAGGRSSANAKGFEQTAAFPPDAGAARPAPGAPQRQETRSGRRSVSGRSLRQGKQNDTIEAIAPDAAALRSRHVARRMDCGSSWTVLRITAVAVVDVGRAQSRY
jgi:hypothetical protein